MKRLANHPVLYGAGVFVVTVAVARLVAYFWPMAFRWHFSSGLHLHHYVFGIFMLTAAGFLALVFKGPRATFGIALLYGLGVGLTFDEFGYWVNPHRFGRTGNVRWDITGLLIVGGALVLAGAVTALARRRRTRDAHLTPSSSR